MASFLKVAKINFFTCDAMFSFLKVAKIDQMKTMSNYDQRFKTLL